MSLTENRISPADRVVVFNTGAAAKYSEVLPLDLPVVHNPAHVDYEFFDG